jgi:hypothetical protein
MTKEAGEMALFDDQKTLADALASFGLSKTGIAAAIGNGSQENKCQPVTTGALDHGSDGVFQWRLDRLTGPNGLQGWAQANGLDWKTIDTQARFFAWECQNYYPVLWRELQSGIKPLATLVLNFCDDYEKPSWEGRVPDTRIKYAQDFYNAAFGKPAPAPAPTPPTPAPILPACQKPAPAPAPASTGTTQMEALILQFLPIVVEAILKGVLAAHGVTPAASSGVSPAPAPAPAASNSPAFDVAALAQEIVSALANANAPKA